MKRVLTIAILLFLVSQSVAGANSEWHIVQSFVQPGVSIQEVSATRLVLYSAELKRQVVLTFDREDGSDFYSKTIDRRGANPYRVWIATTQIWDDPDRPRSKWGKFFKSPFLRIVRPPAEHSNTKVKG